MITISQHRPSDDCGITQNLKELFLETALWSDIWNGWESSRPEVSV